MVIENAMIPLNAINEYKFLKRYSSTRFFKKVIKECVYFEKLRELVAFSPSAYHFFCTESKYSIAGFPMSSL